MGRTPASSSKSTRFTALAGKLEVWLQQAADGPELQLDGPLHPVDLRGDLGIGGSLQAEVEDRPQVFGEEGAEPGTPRARRPPPRGSSTAGPRPRSERTPGPTAPSSGRSRRTSRALARWYSAVFATLQRVKCTSSRQRSARLRGGPPGSGRRGEEAGEDALDARRPRRPAGVSSGRAGAAPRPAAARRSGARSAAPPPAQRGVGRLHLEGIAGHRSLRVGVISHRSSHPAAHPTEGKGEGIGEGSPERRPTPFRREKQAAGSIVSSRCRRV